MNKKKTMLKIESPMIPSELPALMLLDLQLNGHFEMGMVQDCIVEHQTNHKVTFDKIIFKNVTFTEATLSGVELTDIIFEKCDLSNADLSDAVIHRTEFKECKMIGINMTGATLRNVLLDRCMADYATVRFSNAKQFLIQDSSLRQSDFCYSKLHKFELYRSNIDQALFAGTELNGIDLSDCEFNGLGVDVESLKGCIISREQAYTFAALFGLIVKD
ncbi:pentapeptide repeat-containing protein [Paenibacillus piri]|uniref:Pentapeptide repeat-containing protein n=1 Tax=Paenibacillus piri TaxID=2547395 RepID=A0A4R5KL66_9BACL|nr:pentapeptide repeat-containing protein [Paenibacillus piri]TDF95922.1 pentapeptide repeat-containing protein [Paenibacillus piri]